MFLCSEVYSRFLHYTSKLIYEKLKSKTHLYFERSMLESNPKSLKAGFLARNYFFHCSQKNNFNNINYQNTCIRKKIFNLMQEDISLLEQVIKNSYPGKYKELSHLLYCLLIDRLNKGLIYSDPIIIKDLCFEEVVHGKEKFQKNNKMDAMQVFLRSLIWRYLKKHLPVEVSLWSLQKNLISIAQSSRTLSNIKIVTMTMQDKRGQFVMAVPLDFVKRFFEIQKDKAILTIKDSVFCADCSKTFPIEHLNTQMFKTMGISKYTDQQLFTQNKLRTLIIKKIDYMLKVCDIYDEVLIYIKRLPVFANGKQICTTEIEQYLKKILFHLPGKKNGFSVKEKNKIVKTQFENLLETVSQ